MTDYPPIGHLPHSETTNTLTITVERVGQYNRDLCEYVITMTGKEPLHLYYSSVTGSPDLDLAEVAWEAVDLWKFGHTPQRGYVMMIPPSEPLRDRSETRFDLPYTPIWPTFATPAADDASKDARDDRSPE